MVKQGGPNHKVLPLGMVGATKFGEYPIISREETFNMYISDGFLVPYPGYSNVLNISNSISRGGFVSVRANVLFIVCGDTFYIVTSGLIAIAKGTLLTNTGNVSLEENNANQILISDNQFLYCYNYITDTFTVVTVDYDPFTPGYITFQDTFFIVPNTSAPAGSGEFVLSAANNGLSFPVDAQHQYFFQTKADTPQACIRFPSRGNQMWVMGQIVTEAYYDTGAYPQTYQRSTSYNVDYGVKSTATIADGDKFIIWVASNEKSGPVIMVSQGGEASRLSHDGIDYKLAQVQHPELAQGFLFKQNGHLFYQFSFPHPEDNFSYVYDFNTESFFTVTDQNQNVHIAKQVFYFNNTTYFISIIDGNLYEFSTNITNYDYGNGLVFDIPRIRITPTFRSHDGSMFIENSCAFVMEQGIAADSPRIDLSISYDGGYNFVGDQSYFMNPEGSYRNRVQFLNHGRANSFTHQFKFQGMSRFVVGEGVMEVSQ